MRLATSAPRAGLLGLAACALAVAAGCAGLPGDIDDGGRSYQRSIDAPVSSNLEPPAAEASIPIINQRLRSSQQQTAAGGGATSTCDLERWERLMGQTRAAVEAQNLPDNVRVVSAGSMVTQDYDPSRLNIWIDSNDRVYRVVCG